MAMKKCVQIYTDGSCDTTTGRGGWAYLLDYQGQEKLASGYVAQTTNNRMELTAAVRALDALKEACEVKVLTDSQYLKKAFTAGWLANWQRNGWQTANRSPVKNKDLWLELLTLTQRHKVSWQWTKGHAGHEQNERVDKLALAARRLGRAAEG